MCRGVCEQAYLRPRPEVARAPVEESTGTEVGRGSGLRVRSPACTRHGTESEGESTGVDGSRTHQGRLCGTPQTVLKTAEPTGTQPPPRTAIAYPLLSDWSKLTMGDIARSSVCHHLLAGRATGRQIGLFNDPAGVRSPSAPGGCAVVGSWAPGCSLGSCHHRRGSLEVPNTRHSRRCRRIPPRPISPHGA